jgi:hypothetical protein
LILMISGKWIVMIEKRKRGMREELKVTSLGD